MADRTVKVHLIAQATGYIQGMEQAAQKTRETGSEVEKLAQKKQAFQQLGMAAVAFGTALAIGIGFAVAKYAEFDAAMSNANAVLQETVENQELLADAALDAGAKTVFTATESANAIEELGKAGIGTADILGGALYGSLDLAASGQLGVARAAEIAGITLKQFNLEGADAGRVADVLSAGANKAVGSVEDLANGLKFVGPVAASMNVSLEDTVATLALFADRGVIGEQAGTSLRGMLSSLTSPSKQAQQELARLNVTLYDSEGTFLGLENVAGQLQSRLGGLTQAEMDMALGMIFGNQQITAARILVESGASGWRDYRNAVDDSGVAARIAAERLDNLQGDVEKLGGALDTALIQTGSSANDVLRTLVQSATWLVDAIGGAPDPVFDTAVALGAAVAAISLVGGTAFLAVPKLAAFKQGLVDLQVSGRAAAGGITTATLALTAVILVLGDFISRQAESEGASDSFADSLDKATGAVTEYTRQLVAKRLEEQGAFQVLKDTNLTQRELTDAVLAGGDALDKLIAKLKEQTADTLSMNEATGEMGATYSVLEKAAGGVADELDRGRDSWENITAATGKSKDTLSELAGVAGDARSEISDLSEELRGFGSVQYDVIEAESQFRQAIDDAVAAMGEDGFAATLDRATQAGRDNSDALLEMARATNEYAGSTAAVGGTQEEVNAILEEGRQRLYDQAIQFGASADEAQAYADRLIATPQVIQTRIEIDTNPAIASLNALRDALAGNQSALSSLSNWRPSDFSYNYRGNLYAGGVEAFASGGFPSGIFRGVRGGIHKFAEAEMGVPWEAYISGRAADRERNVGIWRDVGTRLGAWQSVQTQQQSGPVEISGYLDIGEGISARIQGQLQSRDVESMQATMGGVWR